LSRIEPIWHDVKAHELTQRSFSHLGDLLQGVKTALQRKAAKLLPDSYSVHFLPFAA
jgi:hypothetical protein